MGATVIAVIGTLAGTLVAGLMQHVSAARRERVALAEQRHREEAERAERRRQELVAACRELIAALTGHRREQYKKIKARREGLTDTPEAREKRYEAHSAVTDAIAGVNLATRDGRLLALASEAISATFALGDASEDELPEVRERSLAAHKALLDAAAKAVA